MKKEKYWSEIEEYVTYEDALIEMHCSREVVFATRKCWSGVHYINRLGEYCILLKNGEIIVEPQTIFDKNEIDWVIVEITEEARNIIEKHSKKSNAIIDINKKGEWDKHKSEIEEALREAGVSGSIKRCNGQAGKFTGAVIEGGLNIMYRLDNKSITIWGVGKRYSNGYISYEDLCKKVEIFKSYMEKVIY